MPESNVTFEARKKSENKVFQFIIAALLSSIVVFIVVYCSFYLISIKKQIFNNKMKYHVMNLAYCIEKDRQLTGLYPERDEVYKKYSDKIKSGGLAIYYVSSDKGKGFELYGERIFGIMLVFDSENPQLGVVSSRDKR